MGIYIDEIDLDKAVANLEMYTTGLDNSGNSRVAKPEDVMYDYNTTGQTIDAFVEELKSMNTIMSFYHELLVSDCQRIRNMLNQYLQADSDMTSSVKSN